VLGIKPLTLLCGPNSSGKSAFMQPLLLVKQTLEVGYDPGALLLQGPNVGFGRVAEMLWHGKGKSDVARSFSFAIRDTDGERTELTFTAGRHGLTVSEVRYMPPHGTVRTPEYVLTPEMSQNDLTALVRRDVADRTLAAMKAQQGGELAISRVRCFLEVVLRRGKEPSTYASTVWDRASPLPGYFASSLLHLPGLRDMPARVYPATQAGDVFPGPFHPYVASIIAAWVDRHDRRCETLNSYLEALSLTWKVGARHLDDTTVALRVGRLPHAQRGGAQDLVSLADVGLGVSQTLPILVALLSARRRQIVYLEQPEIHLHPRAQVALGPILLETAGRGVTVVCETHSSLLLRSIQTAVAKSPSRSRLVNLHWFSRDDDGVTRVSSAEMDAKGAYGQLDLDFNEVELAVESEYLDAVQGPW
jgi:hypothetical protein